MKLLWLFYVPPEQLEFYGSLIGAVVGIIGVYLSVRWQAEKTRKHDKELAEQAKEKERKDREDAKLEEYHRAIMLAESSLQGQVTQLFTNLENLDTTVGLIQRQGISVNLPRTIVFDQATMFNFRNIELVNKWLQMSMSVRRTNELTEDFRAYYQRTTDAVHMLQLQMPTSAKPQDHMNAQVIKDDYEVLAAYGRDVMTATNILVDKTLQLLSLVTVHAKLPNDRFATLAEMNEFRVKLEDYEGELAELRERFNPAVMFTRLNDKPVLPTTPPAT